MNFCKCGCGKEIKEYSIFAHGHRLRMPGIASQVGKRTHKLHPERQSKIIKEIISKDSEHQSKAASKSFKNQIKFRSEHEGRSKIEEYFWNHETAKELKI
jgi:hypothetical protein